MCVCVYRWPRVTETHAQVVLPVLRNRTHTIEGAVVFPRILLLLCLPSRQETCPFASTCLFFTLSTRKTKTRNQSGELLREAKQAHQFCPPSIVSLIF